MFQANGLSPARQRNSCYCHTIAGRAGSSRPWMPWFAPWSASGNVAWTGLASRCC